MGTKFHGSQAQINARTVQNELNKALNIYFKWLALQPTKSEGLENLQTIKTALGSRVDAGVHARNMIGHFDVFYSEDNTLPSLDREKWVRNLNGILPKDLSVLDINYAPDNFHAVKDATSRTYTYKVRSTAPRNPLDENTVTYLYQREPLLLDELNEQVACIVGIHNFNGLSNNRNPHINPVCNVTEAFWVQSNTDPELLIFKITADHFIYNMIRVIIGTHIQIKKGKLPSNAFQLALKTQDRKYAGYKAFPNGLCLESINYNISLF